jgi:hypothetical protein
MGREVDFWSTAVVVRCCVFYEVISFRGSGYL